MPSAGDLLVVEGPTGVGKTGLGIALAQRFNGEIIGADSRQIYRYMDIGTGKPTAEERARAPHHLIDFLDPDVAFSLTQYQALCSAAIAEIAARGKLPILVGGTGQYITAVLEGWHIPEVPPDDTLRAELAAYAEQHGADALFQRLLAADLDAGAFIDPRNVRRVIRALEVSLVSGQPFSAQRVKAPPGYRALELCLTLERTALDLRTDARIDAMLDSGLVDEVRALFAMGYDWKLPAMSSLGYAELGAYLRGESTLEAAVVAFKANTRLFTRRQMTWFRKHGTPRWVDVQTLDQGSLEHTIAAWLNGGQDASGSQIL